MDKLIDIVWDQISRYTLTAHKWNEEQHIYSVCGIIDKDKLKNAIDNYITKEKR